MDKIRRAKRRKETVKVKTKKLRNLSMVNMNNVKGGFHSAKKEKRARTIDHLNMMDEVY